MFNSLFDLPVWISGPAIIAILVIFGIGGLRFVRHRVLPCLRVTSEGSEFSGAMLQTVMVFYGLAVALIAVSVWQTHSDVANTISQEATALAPLAALDRDVSGYPEPFRSEMQNELRDYIEYCSGSVAVASTRPDSHRRNCADDSLRKFHDRLRAGHRKSEAAPC